MTDPVSRQHLWSPFKISANQSGSLQNSCLKHFSSVIQYSWQQLQKQINKIKDDYKNLKTHKHGEKQLPAKAILKVWDSKFNLNLEINITF